MKKYKVKYRNIAMLILALSFLTFTMTGLGLYRTRAALTPLNEDVVGELDVTGLSVVLEENKKVVANGGELLGDLKDALELGKKYEEDIRVKNNGDASEYVRVIVTKYWTKDGEKVAEMDPSLIKLTFNNDEYNKGSWKLNEKEYKKADKQEKFVYYCLNGLKSSEESAPLFSHISIDAKAGDQYDVAQEGNVITYSYAYDGYEAEVKVEVQSVQTSHGTEAIKSVWGVTNVTADDGSLKLTVN